MTLTLALVLASITVGAIHALAPDHWVPFAVLARTERWPAARTVAITVLCGVGHVTVSVVLGLAAAFFGLELVARFGRRLESLAGFLLIGFGLIYGLWGLHRAVSRRWHDHGHGQLHWHGRGRRPHAHDKASGMTPRTLFVLFSADPCVAVVPMLFAAAPLGVRAAVAVVAAYELATLLTMVALVLPARAAAGAVRGVWADQYGVAIAGAIIASVGVAVVGLGW